MRCTVCGAEDGDEHDDGCVPCPGAVGPCPERMWQGEWGCGPTHARYNYAEHKADEQGRRI
jgi:hypothetical protein